jgi:altronate hydrolase
MITKIGQNDNVGIALEYISQGFRIEDFNIVSKESISSGHKISLVNIDKGHGIIKYNQIIGYALSDISIGECVHTHNMSLGKSDYLNKKFTHNKILNLNSFNSADRYFSGYLRDDKKVGTRNYVGVMPTVNCVSTVASKIVNSFSGYTLTKNFDGVVSFNHSQGCGHSLGGTSIDILIKVIVGYISHPNISSLVIIGLGCEDNQISNILKRLPDCYKEKIRYLIVSKSGGTHDSIKKGVELVGEMIKDAKLQKRSRQHVSHLKIALQCGGSDSFSGITSNPVLGYASDKLVLLGGVSILAETPEMYGASDIIFQRIKYRKDVEKLKKKFEWWGEYLSKSNASFDSNPSPGNKDGGITTICEKSLGSVAKAGYSDIEGVVDYADPITENGLYIMDSPGYDPVSVTGQIASGANIVCFTTGRGSTIGFKPSPCIKISSNSNIYSLMTDDIDFDCGGILNCGNLVEELGSDLFDLMINIASGKKTCSEVYDYGDNEFNPWNIGPIV